MQVTIQSQKPDASNQSKKTFLWGCFFFLIQSLGLLSTIKIPFPLYGSSTPSLNAVKLWKLKWSVQFESGSKNCLKFAFLIKINHEYWTPHFTSLISPTHLCLTVWYISDSNSMVKRWIDSLYVIVICSPSTKPLRNWRDYECAALHSISVGI